MIQVTSGRDTVKKDCPSEYLQEGYGISYTLLCSVSTINEPYQTDYCLQLYSDSKTRRESLACICLLPTP
jgi:hypothetical protein